VHRHPPGSNFLPSSLKKSKFVRRIIFTRVGAKKFKNSGSQISQTKVATLAKELRSAIEVADCTKSFIDPIVGIWHFYRIDHIVNTLEDFWSTASIATNHTRSLRFLLEHKQLRDLLKTKAWTSVNWTPLYRLVSKLLLKSVKSDADFSDSHVQELCKIYGLLLISSSELDTICEQVLFKCISDLLGLDNGC
jgi:hypothetical protein